MESQTPSNNVTVGTGVANNISDPKSCGFVQLTPLEMNAIRFNPRHTVITRQVIDKLSASNK